MSEQLVEFSSGDSQKIDEKDDRLVQLQTIPVGETFRFPKGWYYWQGRNGNGASMPVGPEIPMKIESQNKEGKLLTEVNAGVTFAVSGEALVLIG